MLSIPELNEGERYIGATVDAKGQLTHIILLPGEAESMNWEDSKAWG
jgi:hypothetical protein